MKRRVHVTTERILKNETEYTGWIYSMAGVMPMEQWEELKKTGKVVWKDEHATSVYTVEKVK